jgi:putative glutamine amidotransferase
MHRKPKIAVTGSYRRGWRMWVANWLALKVVGAEAERVMPDAKKTVSWDDYDGLVIGGGDDISAQLYGGGAELDIRIDPDRDDLELAALEAFLPSRRPILGICRGAQILNVACGGSLHHDMRAVYRDAPRMRTPLPLKTIEIDPVSELFSIMKRDRVRVNSLHDQSIDRVGDALRVAAKDRYGIIQAVEFQAQGAFRIGVQWHPEFLIYRETHRAIFRTFVDAARVALLAEDEAPAARSVA